jgi:hypothetical protein
VDCRTARGCRWNSSGRSDRARPRRRHPRQDFSLAMRNGRAIFVPEAFE